MIQDERDRHRQPEEGKGVAGGCQRAEVNDISKVKKSISPAKIGVGKGMKKVSVSSMSWALCSEAKFGGRIHCCRLGCGS